MNIEFKLANEANIPIILTMMEEFNTIDNYRFEEKKTENYLLEFLNDPNLGRGWLIKYNKLVVGYIMLTYGYSFEHGGRDASIDELFLIKEFRRKGIGKLAMEFIEKELPSLGVKVIHLEVEQHNDTALKLYKDQGFHYNGRMLLSKKVI